MPSISFQHRQSGGGGAAFYRRGHFWITLGALGVEGWLGFSTRSPDVQVVAAACAGLVATVFSLLVWADSRT